MKELRTDARRGWYSYGNIGRRWVSLLSWLLMSCSDPASAFLNVGSQVLQRHLQPLGQVLVYDYPLHDPSRL